MSTHKNRLSFIAAPAAALLATALLAGCSSAGSTEDFCDVAKEIAEVSEAAIADDTDSMDAASDKIDDLVDDVKPPSEIEDDWKIVIDASEKFADKTEDLDVAKDGEEIGKAFEEMSTDEYQKANENITAFTEENCEV